MVWSQAVPSRSAPLSFFFKGTSTTEIYTLSLHDALPIFGSYRSGLHTPALRLSGFCARPRYVADDGRRPATRGSTSRRRPHNGQSDDSQLSSASSVRQTGRARGPAEVPGGSVLRSASILALVLISA